MSDIETRLRSAIQPTEDATGDWATVLSDATTLRKRSQLTMRASMVGFVLAIGTAIVTASRSGESSRLTPAQGGDGALQQTNVAALLSISLAALLVAAALVGLARRTRPAKPPTGWRRLWPLAVLFPILTAVVFWIIGPSPIAVAFKWLTVPSIPVLLWLLAERVAERPARWRLLAISWSTLGVAVVLGAVALMDQILTRSMDVMGWWRLWPGQAGQEEITGGLDTILDETYTVERILSRELPVMVLIAFMSAIAMRVMATRIPWTAAAFVPVVVLTAITTYALPSSTGVIADYDFFLSDTVLGSMFFELAFFAAPFDFVALAALAFAALSMGVFLAAWGGPVPKEP